LTPPGKAFLIAPPQHPSAALLQHLHQDHLISSSDKKSKKCAEFIQEHVMKFNYYS
jgi:hypothetical protein